jgi:hypothetical protein
VTDQPRREGASEADLVAECVDRHPWGPTEDDEEQVLAGLEYVLNPATGIYEGDGGQR